MASFGGCPQREKAVSGMSSSKKNENITPEKALKPEIHYQPASTANNIFPTVLSVAQGSSTF